MAWPFAIRTELGPWLNFLGAFPVLALAVFVLVVKPRRAPATWLGLFAIGMGSFQVIDYGFEIFAPDVPLRVRRLAELPLVALWAVASLGLARVFPRPVTKTDRVRVLIASAVSIGVAVAFLSSWRELFLGLVEAAFTLAVVAVISSMFGFLVLLVLRYRSPADEGAQRMFALTAAALTVYLGYIGGYGFGENSSGILHAAGPLRWWGLATFVPMFVVGLAWLASMRGRDRRTARNMAWLTFGAMLVGLLTSAGTPRPGGFGVARILMTAMLAYAILQHQLLGIDVKLRFAISKSTIAAVFIAVFFIASEAAQQFFGETLGSTYVGIAAAGALVFAIAPLQRAAERIAEKAVPSPSDPARASLPSVTAAVPVANVVGGSPSGAAAPSMPTGATARSEQSYRKAVRLALRDRRITREEETHLHEIARDLGLDGARAHEILVEMEGAEREGSRRP